MFGGNEDNNAPMNLFGQMFGGILNAAGQAAAVQDQTDAPRGTRSTEQQAAAAAALGNMFGGDEAGQQAGSNIFQELFSAALQGQGQGKGLREQQQDAFNKAFTSTLANSMPKDLHLDEEEQEEFKRVMVKQQMKLQRMGLAEVDAITTLEKAVVTSSSKQKKEAEISAKETLSRRREELKEHLDKSCYPTDWSMLGGETFQRWSFPGDGMIRDSTIATMSSQLNLTHLIEVDFSGCVNLTDFGLLCLGEMAARAPELEKVSLDGCVRVTEQGLEYLSRCQQPLELSLRATSVAFIPEVMVKRGFTFHLEGCPLLQLRQPGDDSEEEIVEMSNITICRQSDDGSSLAEYLVGKAVAKADIVNYKKLYRLGSVDFSITETSLGCPPSEILLPQHPTQVIVPFDIDGDISDACNHVSSTITYFINKCEPLYSEVGVAEAGIGVSPRALFSSTFDFNKGILMVFKKYEEFDDSSDEEDETPSAVFTPTAGRLNPRLEVKLISSVGPAVIQMALVDELTSDVECVPQILVAGDTMSFGLEATDLTCPFSLEYKKYTLSTFKNGKKVQEQEETLCGQYQFVLLTSPCCVLKIENVKSQKPKFVDGHIKNIEMAESERHVDNASGIICNTSSDVLALRSLHPVGSERNQMEVEILKQEKDSKIMLGLTCQSSQELLEYEENFQGYCAGNGRIQLEGADCDPTEMTADTAKCKPGDRMKIVVTDVQNQVMIPEKYYTVHFYKNDNLVSQVKYRGIRKGDQSSYPAFAVSLNNNESIRLLNYRPPQEFQCQVRIARHLSPNNFFVPMEIEGKLKDLEPQRLGMGKGSWSLTSWIPLSTAHSEFEVTVVSCGPSNKLQLGTTTKYDEGSEDHPLFAKPDVKAGDKYKVSLNVDRLNLDKDGYPSPDQEVKLTLTQGGANEEEIGFHYVDGGLHPIISGENVVVKLHNMHLESFYALMSKKQTSAFASGPAFVILGVTNGGKKNSKSKLDIVQDHLHTSKLHAVDSLKEIVNKLGKNPRFETQMVYDHHIKLQSQWQVFEKMMNIKFMSLNKKTAKGLKELEEVLKVNHQNMMAQRPHLYQHLPKVREVIRSLASTDQPEHLLITRDTCQNIEGFTVRQLEAILRLLHDWGKVIFLAKMDPWVAILDVERFVKVLVKLQHAAPADTGGQRVRCVTADTPLWKDTQLASLARSKDMKTPKVLLQVLIESHQLLRLPAFHGHQGDVRSYLLHPLNLKEPSFPLSHFYRGDQQEDNIMSLSSVCEFPVALVPFVKRSILCECMSIAQPVVLAPHFLVAHQGAAQVVVAWQQENKGGQTQVESLIVNVKLLMPGPEREDCSGPVESYGWSIIHLYLDVISTQCLRLHVPFIISPDIGLQPVNRSVCADHEWQRTAGTEDQILSVCTWCLNCSQDGVACVYNKAYEDSLHQCQCRPVVLCCQHCGICPACAQKFWMMRTTLRPNISVPVGKKALYGGKAVLFSVNQPMSPATLNEATVTRLDQTDNLPSYRVGLVSEDGSELIQAYPGPGMMGRLHQMYNYNYRVCATAAGPDKMETAQTITLQLREPKSQYKQDYPQSRTEQKSVTFSQMVNCRLSHTTHCVSQGLTSDLGMIVSELQASVSHHYGYFEADILSLGSRSPAGVGMSVLASIEPRQCFVHNSGNKMMSDCDWNKESWIIGDQIGCGTRLHPETNKQTIFFTHNSNFVCEHPLGHATRQLLYAVIVLQKSEIFQIRPSTLWGNASEGTQLTSEEKDLAEIFTDVYKDSTVRISPSSTIRFPKEFLEGNQILSASLYFQNITDSKLLIKVKTNRPRNYVCAPSNAVLAPQEFLKAVIQFNTKDIDSDEYNMQKDKFLLEWVELKKFEFPEEEVNVSNFYTLWNAKSNEKDVHTHKLGCDFMDVHEKIEKEHGAAEMLQATTVPPVDPSYQLDVLVNGNPTASYWVPRKRYRFMIEREEETESAEGRLEVVKQGLSSPQTLPLSHHLVISMPQLPLLPKEKWANELVTADAVPVRDCCVDHAYLVTVKLAELYKATSEIQTWQTYEDQGCDISNIVTFLPGDMSPLSLLHPSITNLYDTNNMKAYRLCKEFATKKVSSGALIQSPAHLVDTPGLSLQHPLDLKYLYNDLIGVFIYAALATNKVKVPTFSDLLSVGGQLTRAQVESLLQSMITTYAVTCQLYASIKHGSLLNVPHDLTWDPLCYIPPSDDEYNGDFTDPGTILAGRCKGHHSADLMAAETNLGTEAALRACEPYNDVITSLTYYIPEKRTLLPEELWSSLPALKGLDLEGGSQLQQIPDGVSSMRFLQCLATRSQSKLEQLPADIGHCQNLKDLAVPDTLLATLPISLTSCRGLSVLILSDSKLQDIPTDIGKLTKLTHLDLSHSPIMELPSSFGNMKSLRVLKLAGVPWMMPRSGVKMRFDRSLYEKWHEDHSQNKKVLSEKVVHELFAQCDGDKNVVLDEKEMGNINAHLYYMIPRFGHNYQSGDSSGGFPMEVLRLRQLEELDLSYQALRFIPPQISQLYNLTSLNLSHCMELESLPGSIGLMPKLSTLHLRGCPSLRTPPNSIVSRGTEAVLAYHKRLAGGFTENWRTKLMLVGLGAAGKTTLLRALMSQRNCCSGTTDQEVTNGIDIRTWTVRHANGQHVTFSAWDFAGQSVFYNTHQFFLSNRAVYLLLWASRSGYEHAGIEFWLSSIKCHAPNAPIFVVATHYDQVKAELPQSELKKRYPQICGFHFVSSIEGTGIKELKNDILEVTFQESYMGEHVPKVYLTLERKMLQARKDKPFLPWTKVKEYGMEIGIYDEVDVKRAVQFLHDLGTLQYFDNEFLKDYIVINPQWIVDVMACVVTIKDSPIVNGRFYKKDVPAVWNQYPKELHDWLLSLTEAFDLTFPHPYEEANLVPCLLPESTPDDWEWTVPDASGDDREMMIIYKFSYLPAGLFNRLQVRLFQFSDGKAIWKRGSVMKKNGHLAQITQEANQVLQVKVQGLRPENILLLVHEAMESLIEESFHGVDYEYLIPCPDCIAKVGTNNPAMFEAGLIREAVTYNAPFIQCRKYFHTVSMPTVQALMPPNDSSELDIHLEKSIRSLNEIRSSFSNDIFINFTPKNKPNSSEEQDRVNPIEVIDSLVQHGYKCWYDENITGADIQALTVALQESKMMLVMISTEFTTDDQCQQLFLHAAQTLHKPYTVVQIGKDYDWRHTPTGAVIGPQKVFINMRKRVNLDKKLTDLRNQLDQKLKGTKKAARKTPRCFVSYCWSNSDRAVKHGSRDVPGARGATDPRDIKDYIESYGISCWLDIEQTGKRGLFEDITEGIRAADVMIACVSDEYSTSLNCMMELRFAACTRNIPIVFAVVGTGSEWEYGELRILGHRARAPIVNLQKTKDDADMEILLQFVKENILSDNEREQKEKSEDELKKQKEKQTKISSAEVTTISFQEEFELMQRKIMRQAAMLAASMDTTPYPRLFVIDLLKHDTGLVATPRRPVSGTRRLTRRASDNIKLVDVNMMQQQEEQVNDGSSGGVAWGEETLCIKIFCEHEQGWHYTDGSLVLDGMSASEKEELVVGMAPFLGRVYGLIEHSGISLSCLAGEQGRHYKNFIMSHAVESSEDFGRSYIRFREFLMKRDVDRKCGSLSRCVLPTGRISWLCEEHQRGYRVTVLSTDVSQTTPQHSLITEGDRYMKEHLPHVQHLRHKYAVRRPQTRTTRHVEDFLGTSIQQSSLTGDPAPEWSRAASDLFKTIEDDGSTAKLDEAKADVTTANRHNRSSRPRRRSADQQRQPRSPDDGQRPEEKTKKGFKLGKNVTRAFQNPGVSGSDQENNQSQACSIL